MKKIVNILEFIIGWLFIIGTSVLLYNSVAARCVLGGFVYFGIGCFIVMFWDYPGEYLEKHPKLLTICGIGIVFFWLPIFILGLAWGVVRFILEIFGIMKPEEE